MHSAFVSVAPAGGGDAIMKDSPTAAASREAALMVDRMIDGASTRRRQEGRAAASSDHMHCGLKCTWPFASVVYGGLQSAGPIVRVDGGRAGAVGVGLAAVPAAAGETRGAAAALA